MTWLISVLYKTVRYWRRHAALQSWNRNPDTILPSYNSGGPSISSWLSVTDVLSGSLVVRSVQSSYNSERLTISFIASHNFSSWFRCMKNLGGWCRHRKAVRVPGPLTLSQDLDAMVGFQAPLVSPASEYWIQCRWNSTWLFFKVQSRAALLSFNSRRQLARRHRSPRRRPLIIQQASRAVHKKTIVTHNSIYNIAFSRSGWAAAPGLLILLSHNVGWLSTRTLAVIRHY
jgi:hypothetical protein